MRLVSLSARLLALLVVLSPVASAQSGRSAPTPTRIMPAREAPAASEALQRPEAKTPFDLGIEDGVDTAPFAMRAGGPDGFGYSYVDSDEVGGPMLDWVDISSTSATPGTAATTAQADDATQLNVALPFAFPFYGSTYSTVNIGSNGAASFANTIPAGNGTIPSTGTPNQLLAPFWDDLHMGRTAANSEVRYRDMGDGRFVISWIRGQYFRASGANSVLTFQVILSQNGDVRFQYLTVDNGTETDNSSTVGIEGSGATGRGLQVNRNGAGYLKSGLVIAFTPPVPDAVFGSAAMVTQQDGEVAADGTSLYFASTNNVVLSGTNGSLPVTSFTFDLGGTIAPADILEARLFYTGSANTPPDAGSPEFGTGVLNPGASATLTGTQAVQVGNNYFWLVLRIADTATPGETVSNAFTSVTVDGTVRTPSPTTLGNVLTIAQPPPNDDFADARVVTSGNYTDSQTNENATLEMGEAIASCAFSNNDGTESIWYSYTPGTTGSATISAGGFDTVLVLYTGASLSTLTEVECRDAGGATTAESITTTVTAGTTYYARVTGYNGNVGTVAFSVTGPAPAGTPPMFSLTPTTTQTLGTAGACTSTTMLSTTFTAANTGSGMVNVTGATLTGDASFTVDTSSLPVMLASGDDVDIVVTFTPTVGQSGAVSTQFAVQYDDGTAQSSTPVTVEATATDASASAGSQAGIFYRNADGSACTSASMAPAPSGTAFLDIDTHTQITTWTDDGPTGGDDSYFTLDAAALDALVGSVRIFGKTYETMNVQSNGALITTVAGGAPNTLPTTTFGDAIIPFGLDLDIRTSSLDADDPAEYPVAVYYGLSDGDGDGAADDMVVTWFHAYDYTSISAPRGYTDATVPYITFQLVIVKADRANQDDLVEVRFPSGDDGASIPYSRLVTGAFENDATIGMTQGTSTAGASVEYRENTVGGPVFLAGGAANAVRFTPETQATATQGGALASAGYHLMGVPVQNYTVDRLAALNLVQGIAGGGSAPAQYADAGSNLYTSYNGGTGTYGVPATTATVIAPGRGFFWHLYDQDITVAQANSSGLGTGTSRSYVLPMALQGTGAEPAGDVTVPLAAGEAFVMIANPFRAGLEVSSEAGVDVDTWQQGGMLASRLLQTWDPGAGSYISSMSLPTPDLASAWQGFFVENNVTGGATSLLIPRADRVAGGTFVGRDATEAPAVLAFELAGTTADGAPTMDRAATLVLAEDAVDGWDPLDASKLAPLAVSYATVAFQGERDGQPRLKAQDSRSTEAQTFDVPLVVDAVGTAPALTLSWAGIEALPETWAFELRDLATGTTVDMRASASYTFEQSASAARTAAVDVLARTTTAGQDKAADAARFVLHVTTGRSTAGEAGAPTTFALAAPAPNPTAGAARIAFDVPETANVSVAVYDLLGRRVAVLADGTVTAGRHTARLDAGSLAPGVYVVRMASGTFAATQRVTVVR